MPGRLLPVWQWVFRNVKSDGDMDVRCRIYLTYAYVYKYSPAYCILLLNYTDHQTQRAGRAPADRELQA